MVLAWFEAQCRMELMKAAVVIAVNLLAHKHAVEGNFGAVVEDNYYNTGVVVDNLD